MHRDGVGPGHRSKVVTDTIGEEAENLRGCSLACVRKRDATVEDGADPVAAAAWGEIISEIKNAGDEGRRDGDDDDSTMGKTDL